MKAPVGQTCRHCPHVCSLKSEIPVKRCSSMVSLPLLMKSSEVEVITSSQILTHLPAQNAFCRSLTSPGLSDRAVTDLSIPRGCVFPYIKLFCELLELTIKVLSAVQAIIGMVWKKELHYCFPGVNNLGDGSIISSILHGWEHAVPAFVSSPPQRTSGMLL